MSIYTIMSKLDLAVMSVFLHYYCVFWYNFMVLCYTVQWLTRGKKVQSRGEREIWYQFLHFREEKEKSDTNFSNFERRKRNMKLISPISRGEREIWISFPQFREEKEKSEFFSQLSRRDRERYIRCSSFENRKRNLA